MFSVKRISQKIAIATMAMLMMPTVGSANFTPGSTAGTFNVASGNANYSIAIATPPGRAGMQPSLSLNYSSAAGNGPLGLGWSLGGISRIHRCAKTNAQDGIQGSINLNISDRFCLDGQKLIAVSGFYGADGTEYRTETDSYTKIVSYGNSITIPLTNVSMPGFSMSPDSFKVWTKSGLIQEYGATEDSTIEIGDAGAVNVWAISNIVDSTINDPANSGDNKIEFHYIEEESHYEYRLDRITNSDVYIQIGYNERADDVRQFIAGEGMHVTKRIEKITSGITVFGEDHSFRDYKFHYQYSSRMVGVSQPRPVIYGSSVSFNDTYDVFLQLKSVVECAYTERNQGFNNVYYQKQCYKPTVFEWDYTAPSLQMEDRSGDITTCNYCSKNYVRTFADVNGDGFLDAVAFRRDSVDVALGNKEGRYTELTPWITGFGYEQYWRTEKHVRTLADVNGDGRADIVGFNDAGVVLALSEGDKFVFQGPKPDGLVLSHFGYNSDMINDNCSQDCKNWTPNSHQRFLADVNGDGRADIVGFGNINGNGGTHVSFSTGNGFKQPEELIDDYSYDEHSYDSKTLRFVLDMNADGMADIVVIRSDGVVVELSTGVGFEHKGKLLNEYCDHCSLPYSSPVLVDKCPVYFPKPDYDGPFAPATKSSSSTRALYECKDKYTNYWDWDLGVTLRTFGDVNGDGYPDIVGFGKEGIYISLSTGKFEPGIAFSPGQKVTYPGYLNPGFDNISGWGSENQTRVLADVNGDNRADIVALGKDSAQVLFLEENNNLITGEISLSLSRPQNFMVGFHSEFKTDQSSINTTRTITDINGDGFADLVGFFGSGIKSAVRLPAGDNLIGSMQLLSAVTDGMGNRVDIEYKPMTDESVYTKGTYGDGQPGIPTQYARYLVSASYSTNGAGLTKTDQVDYRYGDFRVDVGGRGGLGFAWEEAIDHTAGKITRREFSQKFPMIGYPIKVEEYLLNTATGEKGARVNLSTRSYQDVSTNAKTYSPQLKQRIDKTYKSNAVNRVVTTITTENNRFDDFGNIEEMVITTSGGGESFKTKTTSLYDNDSYNWYLGRLTDTTVEHTGSDGQIKQRVSKFDYYPDTGLLKSETIEPTSPLASTTLYEYDKYGNITNKTTSSLIDYPVTDKRHVVPRVAKTIYDTDKKFPEYRLNSLGHKETLAYNRFCGEVDYLKGPNNLDTEWEYDAFCRKTKEKRTDDTETNWLYQTYLGNPFSYIDINEESYPAFMITAQVKLSSNNTVAPLPPTVTYYDSLGRELRTQTTGFDGRLVTTDTVYNEKGQIIAVSQPYYPNEQIVWVISEYDELGRLVRVNRPGVYGGQVYEGFVYNGLEKVQIDAKGHRKTSYSNAKGQLTRVEEEEGSWVSYQYDPLGNLEQTNANGIITTIRYDVHGNKESMNDPDMGHWQYKYNALGELIWQKDATGNEVNMSYDALGRMKSRSELEGETHWEYDNAATMGIGKLDIVTSTSIDAFNSERYEYDNKGRLHKTFTTIDTEEYVVTTHYDNFGRVEKVVRPGGLEVENVYNHYGYLEGIRSPYRQVNDDNYDHSQLISLIENSAIQIAELQQQAIAFEELAVTLRLLATQEEDRGMLALQNAVLQRSSTLQYSLDAEALRNLADDLESEANRYWAIVAQYEQLRIDLVVEAVATYGYDQIFQDPEPILVPIMMDGITIFVPLSVEGVASLDTPLMEKFSENYSGQEQEYRTEISNNIALAEQYMAEAATSLSAAKSNELMAAQYRQDAEAYFTEAKYRLDLAEQYKKKAEQYKTSIAQLEKDLLKYKLMRGHSGSAYYWRANEVDAHGRVTSQLAGNGISTQHQYDRYTGQLKSIRSDIGGLLGSTRDLEYQYDDLNNVTQRADRHQKLTESFLYDRLDRLVQSDVTGSLMGDSYSNSIQYQYDTLGNISYKSDVGNYSYGSMNRLQGNAGPHAVRSAGTKHINYQYDDNGNLLEGGGRTYQWSTFNKPTEIRNNTNVVNFAYGHDRSRIKKSADGTVTHYVGKLYERSSAPGDVVKHKHFIYAQGAVVAIQIKSSIDNIVQPDETRYLHHDALGSVDTITDGQGSIVERMSYDPFGKRRNIDWRADTLNNPLPLPILTNRGFTGHEHIDEMGLIHMNGRVYDPEIGRFISADTIVPSAEHSQAYNRYSYTLNNPLKYTDPSGHSWVHVAIFVVGAMMATSDNAVVSGIGMGMMTWASGGLYGMEGAGAAIFGGMTTGFVNGYIQTGSFDGAMRGAVIGGLSATMFYTVGHGMGLEPGFGKIVAHGVAGGLMSEMQGGDFGQGFMSASVTQMIAPGIETIDSGPGRVIAAAMLGGTVSELSGGKFANGAMTGAFSRMFNDEMDSKKLTSEQERKYQAQRVKEATDAILDLERMSPKEWRDMFFMTEGVSEMDDFEVRSHIKSEVLSLSLVRLEAVSRYIQLTGFDAMNAGIKYTAKTVAGGPPANIAGVLKDVSMSSSTSIRWVEQTWAPVSTTCNINTCQVQ